MSVCIPCAILLLRKPHDNNEYIEFLTQIRQTKHRTNRTENQHGRATNQILVPKFRVCADVIQLCRRWVVGGSSAGKSRLEQQIANVKSIAER